MKKLKGAAKIAGIISMSLVMGCCSSGDLKGPSYTFPSPTPTTLIPTQTSASTSTPVPTIPPTFTPAPTATPTSTHEPVEWVPMSEEDQAAYDRALAEIEIYRKGDVSLIVVDANGDPMPGIKVSYKQTEGPIDWGVWQEPMYFHYVQELDIDLIAIYMIWNDLEPEPGIFNNFNFLEFQLGLPAYDRSGFEIHMTLLSYVDAYDFYKDTAPELLDPPFESQIAPILDHVEAQVACYASQVDSWAAFGEPSFSFTNPYHWSPEQYMEGIRRTVEIIHRLDPTASIVLDQSYACDWDSRWHIQQLIENGIEFDKLILQFEYNSYANPLVSNQHFGRLSLAEQSRCIDDYADFLEPYGVSIGPTDPYFSSAGPPNSPGYWGHPWSENLQAQYLEVINTILFSKPVITILGYQQPVGHPAHCMLEGGIVDRYGMPLKAYWVLQDLMQRWKTSGETVTDNTGSIAFHGFAGLYSFEICTPDSMDCMYTEVELEGEGSSELTIVFEPNDMLAPLREQLVTLRDYWQDRGDSAKTQHADDLLALVDYHRDRHEWDMAQQVIAAGLKELVIETRLHITPDMLRTAGWSHGGFERLPENQLFLNGNTTVYYPYNFPPGEVEVRVTARYRNDDTPQEHPGKASAGSEWPNMIIGADANYSEWLQVNDRELQVYSAVLPLQGTEEVLSIHCNMDHDDYQSAGFIIANIEIIIRSSQPQAAPLINRPPVNTDLYANILEYLLLNEQEPKSTFILDQRESDQGTGQVAASLEMDTPFTVRLNIDGKGDDHWVDLYSTQGEAGMYIGSWDRSGVVLIFYDERGDEYSVGYPIDIVRWGEPFSIEFLDPQGKSLVVRNNEDQVAARVNMTQFEDLHLSGGLFPNGKINVGIIVGPGSSLMIRELLFEFGED